MMMPSSVSSPSRQACQHIVNQQCAPHARVAPCHAGSLALFLQVFNRLGLKSGHVNGACVPCARFSDSESQGRSRRSLQVCAQASVCCVCLQIALHQIRLLRVQGFTDLSNHQMGRSDASGQYDVLHSDGTWGRQGAHKPIVSTTVPHAKN